MPVIKMFIDKFHGEVMIDADHPLAVAQRAKNAAVPTDTPKAIAPAVQETPAPSFAALSATMRPRKRKA
jgi:hypothetical protein